MDMLAVPEKKPWQSITLWTTLVSAVVAFIPPVSQWIGQHPETYSTAVSVVFAVLRMITKDKLTIS